MQTDLDKIFRGDRLWAWEKPIEFSYFQHPREPREGSQEAKFCTILT